MKYIKYIIYLLLIAVPCIAQVRIGGPWLKDNNGSYYQYSIRSAIPLEDNGSILYPVFNTRIMTGNTSPSPVVVSANSEYSGSYAAWMAFDFPPLSTYWNPANTIYPQSIEYDCGIGNSNVVSSFSFVCYSGLGGFSNYTILGSMDHTNYTLIHSGFMDDVSRAITFINNSSYYRIYKLNILDKHPGNDGYTRLFNLEFSSASFRNPYMSDTNIPAPYNVSSSGSANPDYYAFDGDYSTFWSQYGSSNWITFDFGSNVVINGYTIINLSIGNGVQSGNTYGSTNGIDFILIDNFSFADSELPQVRSNNNNIPYRWYMFDCTNTWGDNIGMRELIYNHYK